MKKIVICICIILTLSIMLIGCSSTSDDLNSPSENGDSTLDAKIVATIYTSDSQAENLIDKEVNLNELTPNSLFDALKTSEIIPLETKLNSFNTYKENGISIGIADFSEEFYNFNLGSSGEILMLNSIAKTYIQNLHLDKFKILVDGEEYQSGHILYEKDDYFTLNSID